MLSRAAVQMSLATVMTRMMPVLFLSHGGGPCFFMDSTPGEMFSEIDKKSKAAAFYRNLRTTLKMASSSSSSSSNSNNNSTTSSLLPEPSAILVISAHWEAKPVQVLSSPAPPMYYDYYGFPAETYKLDYPAPGSPTLALRVQALLQGAGIECQTDAKRGFDHGVFIPLKQAFPEAKIPTIQLSIHPSLDPALHIQMGKALAPLRKEGVLIIGSGQTTHNLGNMDPPDTKVPAWASQFVQWLDETLLPSTVAGGSDLTPAQRLERLAAAPSKAPQFRKSHPREEHFTPILVAAAAAFSDVVVVGGGTVMNGAGAGVAEVEGGTIAATTTATRTTTTTTTDATVAMTMTEGGEEDGKGVTTEVVTTSASVHPPAIPAGTATKLYSQFVLGGMSLASYRFD